MSNPSRSMLPVWLRLIIVAALIGMAWSARNAPRPAAAPMENAAAHAPEAEGPRPLGSSERDDKLLIKSVTLKDQSGRVIYQGDIDLGPTLDRIAAGKKLRFPHDGSVFQNRERRLPKQPSGHYREYVVPTPGDDGPGPQRLVVGDDGEAFYTPDHYRTFRRVK